MGLPKECMVSVVQVSYVMNKWVEGLQVGTIILSSFKLQLGMTREPYGFDGILGIDFMTAVGLKVDFKKMNNIEFE